MPTQEAWETRVPSLGPEDPLEEGMATPSGFSPGKAHGQRSLAGYSPRGRKASDTTEVTQHERVMLFVSNAQNGVMNPPSCFCSVVSVTAWKTPSRGSGRW